MNRYIPFPELQRRTPASVEELSELLRQAAASSTPVYPIGGGTALGYGGLPTKPGWGLSLQGLRRVVDYPARDLTITVEAGLTAAELQALLAQQGQRWPVDTPQPNRATVGGLVACNLSGPRRYAWGRLSDYVLGLTAVDGQGMVFSAGARVVKNAAGYNLCRLLAGSLGTLAVIAQVTLMVKPLPETTAFVVGDLEDWDAADRLLSSLGEVRVLPTAVELLAGPAWADDPWLGRIKPTAKARLAIGWEGSAKEVAWQIEQVVSAWQTEGVRDVQTVPDSDAQKVWRRLTEFSVPPSVEDVLANGLPPGPGRLASPCPDDPRENGISEVAEKWLPQQADGGGEGDGFLVVQASVLPSRVLPLMARWLQMDRQVSILAHAASGGLVGYFPLGTMEAVRWVREWIFPSIVAQEGAGQVLFLPSGVVLGPEDLWTPSPGQDRLVQAIKQRFDPQGILNPGRLGLGV